jgi:hypothetical protein
MVKYYILNMLNVYLGSFQRGSFSNESNEPKSTPPILPERVVEIGWGLTLAYSSSADENATIAVDKLQQSKTD